MGWVKTMGRDADSTGGSSYDNQHRRNRVKALKNIGQYLIDHADELVPEDINGRACKQTFTIVMYVEREIPRVEVNTEYIASETLIGVDWE
jgi:hypothetical protein